MVLIGSARINENGQISGGKAGDQTGKECCTEPWYLHTKGWIVFRAKSAVVRERIARDMQYICDNDNIGYDQPRDQSLYNAAKPYGFDCSKVTVKCDTDCARALRVCILYAGINVPDFYTVTEPAVLRATGAFDELTSDLYCKSSSHLVRGDILVTPVKGHTAVVMNDGAEVYDIPEPENYLGSYAGVWKALYSNKTYLRASAGKDGEILDTISGKMQAVCFGYYTMISGTVWLFVQCNGKAGYCSTKYIHRIGDVDKDTATMFPDKRKPAYIGQWKVTAGNKTHIRRGAGTSYRSLGILYSGDRIECCGFYSVSGNTVWLYVKRGETAAFVSTKYIERI